MHDLTLVLSALKGGDARGTRGALAQQTLGSRPPTVN